MLFRSRDAAGDAVHRRSGEIPRCRAGGDRPASAAAAPHGRPVQARGAPDHAAQRHCRRTQLHRKYPGAGMTLRIGTLPNGLRVVSEAMPQVKTVSVGIWVAAGARDETPETNLVAHMLEHMASNGTRLLPAIRRRSWWGRVCPYE